MIVEEPIAGFPLCSGSSECSRGGSASLDGLTTLPGLIARSLPSPLVPYPSARGIAPFPAAGSILAPFLRLLLPAATAAAFAAAAARWVRSLAHSHCSCRRYPLSSCGRLSFLPSFENVLPLASCSLFQSLLQGSLFPLLFSLAPCVRLCFPPPVVNPLEVSDYFFPLRENRFDRGRKNAGGRKNAARREEGRRGTNQATTKM